MKVAAPGRALPQRTVWLLAVFIVAVGAFVAVGVATGSTLTEDASSDCVVGAVWHYRMAANYTADQGYHYGAAKSLEAIEAVGGSCEGWEQDRGQA